MLLYIQLTKEGLALKSKENDLIGPTGLFIVCMWVVMNLTLRVMLISLGVTLLAKHVTSHLTYPLLAKAGIEEWEVRFWNLLFASVLFCTAVAVVALVRRRNKTRRRKLAS